jgi:hypothetical protein
MMLFQLQSLLAWDEMPSFSDSATYRHQTCKYIETVCRSCQCHYMNIMFEDTSELRVSHITITALYFQ